MVTEGFPASHLFHLDTFFSPVPLLSLDHSMATGPPTTLTSDTKPPKPPRSPEEEQEETEAAAHQAENTIVAGDEDDDGYESDSASRASTSLSSSMRDYTFENGRRYHKFREGQYQFPVSVER